jgi:hypothetical protein
VRVGAEAGTAELAALPPEPAVDDERWSRAGATSHSTSGPQPAAGKGRLLSVAAPNAVVRSVDRRREERVRRRKAVRISPVMSPRLSSRPSFTNR